jgi:hypothetical protein
LIAAGGGGGAGPSIGALGGPGLFRISELAAVILIFSGYLLSTPRPAPAQSPATV